MAREDYIQAYKLGQKVHREKIIKGEFPYLPVLDWILSHVEVEDDIPLGIMDIPLCDVVGTLAEGRTQAFAPNFMPILEYGSEFSAKWSSLYDYQVEEGIGDAIKVYEYMQKYYVVEGHKRVSVLKYLGAPTISAEVIRKMPKKTDDLECILYYEYVDFFEKNKMNYLHFSKPGSYKKLMEVLKKDEDHVFTDDEKLDLAFFHAHFEKAYNTLKDKTTEDITCDDAMIFYLSLYPFEENKDLLENEIKQKLLGIWSEISTLSRDDNVEILTDATPKKNLMTSMLNSIMPSKYKVAFVYDKEPEKSAWTYSHELGRLQIVEDMPDNVESKYFVISDSDEKADEKIGKLCEDGYNVIFIVTPNLINESIKVAAKYPNVYMFNCQLGSSHNKVRSYYTRLYEAKFLTGMIAGALCENGKVGYIADYPIKGVVANINAFALGAKMVNPNVKIYLSWSSSKEDDNDKLFWEEGINLISAQDMITPEDDARKFGLYRVEDDVKTGIAMSAYHWGNFYKKLIDSVDDGTIKNTDSKDNKAINYWWGFSADVIDLICSAKIPDETQRLVKTLKSAIKHDIFRPFEGVIKNQAGEVVVEKGVSLTPEEIMVMDYLVDNVVGSIPELEEIEDSGKKVVELLGVKES